MGYQLEGQLLEVCTCKVLCPCWIGEDPDFDTCEGVVAYHVKAGNIDGTDVSGLSVVWVADIPGNILKGGIRSLYFVDAAATQDQADALRRAFGGQAGGPLADLAGLSAEARWESAPISFSVVEGHGSLAVGDIARAEMEPYRGPHGAVTTLNESIFSNIPGSPAYVAKASVYERRASAYGLRDVSLSGHNAIEGSFRFTA